MAGTPLAPARAGPARDPMNLPARTDIRRILIVKWSALGDVVIATTAMEDIRRAFPAAEIDLNTMPAWTGLFDHDPRFAHVFAVDLRRTEGGLKGVLRWLRRVRAGRYDLVVDLQANDRSRFLLGLLWLLPGRPRFRLGYRGWFPYNIHADPLPMPYHVFDRTRTALANAGIPQAVDRPVLHVTRDNEAAAAKLMAEHGLAEGRFAVFVPGCQAAGFLKRWGAERYAELARRLVAEGLERVALIGGPDEADELARIAALAGPAVVNLCGQTRILDLVPLVRAARFVVTNDTGPGHVAAAAGRPITVICGPTDPRRVKPVGPRVTALQADQECLNCYCKRPCELDHSCMTAITPDRVLATVRPYLKG
jgi:lipopolysaccharide heptosyltransferase II